jgi:protein O-GlcNAc transferase
VPQSDDMERAASDCIRAPALKPDDVSALYLLGVTKARQGRFEQAIAPIQEALKLMPGHPVILASYANVLNAVGRHEEALASCAAALRVDPHSPDALIAQSVVLFSVGRFEDAVASCDSLLAFQPSHALAWNNRAVALYKLNRFEEALEACDRVLALEPHDAEARINRGNALYGMGRFMDALDAYDRALASAPGSAMLRSKRGDALFKLNRFEEALASYDVALASDPSAVSAVNGRGLTLFHLGLPDEAMKCFEAALALQPSFVEAWNNRARTLHQLSRFTEALECYNQALAIDNDSLAAREGAFSSALNLCSWNRLAALADDLKFRVQCEVPVSPFCLLAITDDNELQFRCARNFAHHLRLAAPTPAPSRRRHVREKIRIAYLSADFFKHPVAYQVAQLLALHDRSTFEIYGFSAGPDDGSEVRARIVKACDHFLDVGDLDDAAVGRLLRDREIDILVDLNGYTEGSRVTVFGHRPCPIQVSWMGYPGTLGGQCADYIIADSCVVPAENQEFFSEKVVYLPNSFFPSDSGRTIAAGCSRREMNLPDEAFVFCCFNAAWKLSSSQFDLWMRLLHAVPGSVLWLRGQPGEVTANLKSESAARGVDPRRLVFAEHVATDVHLGRQRLADLFLDTVPYNAHATASDALWAGLPVLTCKTRSFPGRVGASLLGALGLPELIVEDLQAYESVALELARQPGKLAILRNRLLRNRKRLPLFDTERLCRNVESLYLEMIDRLE